ncbi:uncharacterized protein LOC127279683 [Leptopilina boulardi]|uniref:uncharacterized protein LOC127279683 n=1 Tax=Leptopilina boulardi TaxID=63433 RepID=UPI0021F63C28|nr:uncharacterized protein LOC127279683 [Leptopilina boulardi]
MSLSQDLPETLEIEIKCFAKEKNILNPKFYFSNASKDGDNFLGCLYRVRIESEENGETTEMNLIFKCLPISGEMRHLLRTENLFLSEITFYELRFPMFVKLLEKYEMTMTEVPRYYGCRNSPGNKIIIMEDLNSKGYMMKESKLLDYSHATMAIRLLGKFHACSFALRDKRPEEFEHLRKIEEPLFPAPEQLSDHFDALVDVALESIKDEDEYYKESVRALKKNITQLINDACDGRNSEPYATLNHGDMWTNNMLFKYNENHEPVDIRLLDYQLCRYGSPSLDLMYMLMTCCTPEMRRKHCSQLLNDYYDSLSNCLKKMDCDVKKLFPFNVLIEHLQKYGAFCTVLSLVDIHLIAQQEGEDIQPLTNIEYIKSLTNRLKTNKLYYNMMKSVVKDMVDKNFICHIN